jgi:hypothetical protein
VTQMTGCTAFGEWRIEPRPPWTSGTGNKLRLAIAAFYDADRLAGALREFVLLGVLPDDLCLLIDDGRDDARAALRRALEACGNLFARLSESAVSASIIPEVPLILCTDTPVLHVLQQARTAMGTTCLEALLQGEVGEEIKRHVRSGAIIAMAKAGTPKLQDHCVRALLRHSLHTVHSEESGYICT